MACGDEWSARALETVLQPVGCGVVRTGTGAAAREQARNLHPDAVLIAEPLPDTPGIELCRAMRRDPLIAAGVPIIGLATALPTREHRLAWLRAGAWDFFTLPLDAEELVLKLERHVRAGSESALEAFVDPGTGLYSRVGLRRRARELAAEAERRHGGLACVVLRAAVSAAPAADRAAVRRRLGAVLRAAARLSDTVGWWDDTEVAIFAPATDSAGAARLGRRLADAVTRATSAAGGRATAIDVEMGYDAVSDLQAARLDADDLLARAHGGLRGTTGRERGGPARGAGSGP